MKLIDTDLYIVGLGIFTFVILYPAGNLSSTDAYFFGVSGSTESGLNVEDMNNLLLYQQIALYFIPILGNMQVVSILIVIFRFVWFRQRLKSRTNQAQIHRAKTDPVRGSLDLTAVTDESNLSRAQTWSAEPTDDPEPGLKSVTNSAPLRSDSSKIDPKSGRDLANDGPSSHPDPGLRRAQSSILDRTSEARATSPRIRFAPEPQLSRQHTLLTKTISSDGEFPLDEKRGQNHDPDHDVPEMGIKRALSSEGLEASMRLRTRHTAPRLHARGLSPDRISLHRVVTSVFELGGGDHVPVRKSRMRDDTLDLKRLESRESSNPFRETRKTSKYERLRLSTNAILGRNSNFSNLTSDDKDRLGGIEYRSLKLLLKVILSYYISLHLIGIISLTPWIYLTQETKYREYLADKGINYTWW